jgi:integrase
MAYLVKRGQTWYVRYKQDNQMKWVSCRTSTKKLAEEVRLKYQNFEAKGFHDLDKKRKDVSLEDFLEVHLNHAETTHSPGWLKNKRLIFKNFLVPFFGEKTLLKQITKARIEDYRAERLKTVSPRTVNIEINCLMAMLRHAIDRDELEEDYLPKIKKLQEAHGRVRFLTRDEIAAIREAAHAHSPEMEAYVLLMLFAGLRSGEALSLRWEDIDFGQKVLYITARADWKPKSGKGRVIPIPKDLHAFLGARQPEIPDAVLVVYGHNTPYMLKRRFQAVVIAANLPTSGEKAVTAHVLRHTYASYLVMRGVPLYTVSGLLGHSTVKTTEIYAHLAPDHLKAAVQEIDYL